MRDGVKRIRERDREDREMARRERERDREREGETERERDRERERERHPWMPTHTEKDRDNDERDRERERQRDRQLMREKETAWRCGQLSVVENRPLTSSGIFPSSSSCAVSPSPLQGIEGTFAVCARIFAAILSPKAAITVDLGPIKTIPKSARLAGN